MPVDNALFIAKFAFLGLLYLFLLQVLLVIHSDLREMRKAKRNIPSSSTPHLEILSGRDMLDEHHDAPLVPLSSSLSLGRDPSNDIPVSDAMVSSFHCRISREEQGYRIQDLGSTNGTWVNDTRIESPLSLRKGDTIRLGAVTFRFAGEG
ncbi:MAG: FHA domain-containing protein [Candidatus Eremiobacteraeota bacterium]|nr:FHA domain-containing protein [Candidatus Eremiobacteraeota bacterium]